MRGGQPNKLQVRYKTTVEFKVSLIQLHKKSPLHRFKFNIAGRDCCSMFSKLGYKDMKFKSSSLRKTCSCTSSATNSQHVPSRLASSVECFQNVEKSFGLYNLHALFVWTVKSAMSRAAAYQVLWSCFVFSLISIYLLPPPPLISATTSTLFMAPFGPLWVDIQHPLLNSVKRLGTATQRQHPLAKKQVTIWSKNQINNHFISREETILIYHSPQNE